MMKKLLSTRQEAQNAKRPHGTFIMLLLFALLLNSQNSFSQIYDFTNDVDGFDDGLKNLTVVHNNAGYLDCTTNGDNDPQVSNNLLTNAFSTDDLDQLNIRVKNGTSHTNALFIIYTDNLQFNVLFRTTTGATEFEDLSVDLTSKTSTSGTGSVAWSDGLTVTKIRVDPNGNGAVGTISFDYIRFQDSSTLSSSNTQVSEVKTTLYPNPVKRGQDVNIQLANINKQQYKHIAVYDLQGRSVINRTLDSNESPKLSTSQLTKGLYFVHLGGEDSSEVFKLIVD